MTSSQQNLQEHPSHTPASESQVTAGSQSAANSPRNIQKENAPETPYFVRAAG